MWSFLEIVVCDLARSLAWYTNTLRFEVILHDEEKQFVLLQGTGFRLALKTGERPAPLCAVRLHLEVEDLQAEVQRLCELGHTEEHETKASDEGYRRVKLADPDGNEVILFAWNLDRGWGSLNRDPSHS